MRLDSLNSQDLLKPKFLMNKYQIVQGKLLLSGIKFGCNMPKSKES